MASAGRESLLDGLRVVDFSTQIAGPYCTKVLVDAGADVVKVEAASGDPLRTWSASGADLAGGDGALFKYLNSGKRSVIGSVADLHVATLVAGCDVVVESGQLAPPEIDALRALHPALVVVSVTSFGRFGPHASRPATEFTLQAACGSIASRGTNDREPLHAGGRLGEWIAGIYTAVAATGAARVARRDGAGDHVDVSMIECMAITMGGGAGLANSMGSARPPGPARTIEMPSIEPTADGYVGFCTITGQQFKDFLVLIDRADLLDDTHLASFVGRQARRVEFLKLVSDWTTKRTTAEIIELASAMRIPVAPIGTPETITAVDQFTERKVFGPSADATFVQPRVPYRIDQIPQLPLRPAPRLGEHTASATWPSPRRAPAQRSGAQRLPLDGVRVVDLTAFWAGPVAGQMLAVLGADVIKVESAKRPDGMRMHATRPMSEAGWYEWSSVYQGANFNKRGITIDLSRVEGRDLLLRLIGVSDVVIENFSPRVLDNFGITWELVHQVNPRALLARMPAFGLDGPWRDRTGFAQTMEQVSGMAWMTGFRDGPALIPRGPCDPIAGIHAVAAVLAALEERDRHGEGHLIESTMVEAALNVAAEVVIEWSAYGAVLSRDGNRGPVAAPQGVYRCRGDDVWLAIAITDDQQWRALCAALGRSDWASVPGWSTPTGRRGDHDAIDAALASALAERDADEVADALIAAGVPAARVVDPIDVTRNEQLRARGFVETIDHPLLGRHELLGVPFRFASRPGAWVQRPAPMLGEHNAEVLDRLLGLDDNERARLQADGLIGDRLG